MTARLRMLFGALSETFWLVPALLVLAGILGARGLVQIDRSGWISNSVLPGDWLYDGGGTGARTLLGAIVSSTIGVAGTVFSITIAALSLAAGQMGPRLLRNFTRDRGNQTTLGIFLATFSYALMVLRSVRAESEGAFVPHLALSVGILLAFVCVATLIYFVHHMAGRINVDEVIELVSGDLRSAIERLPSDEQPCEPPDATWRDATVVTESRRGYLQQLDEDGLADWAKENDAAIRLLVRPGDYVFPGAPVALITRPLDDAETAIRSAMALGAQRGSSADLEYAVRQLVEVAVRALSPGINDPHTAISVIDRIGAALCSLKALPLPSGVHLRDGELALVVPAVTYDGLTDTMLHMIRQNAARSPAVLIRLIEVLTAVVSCETDPARCASLQRHADLVLEDARRNIQTPADLQDIAKRRAAFAIMRCDGPRALVAPGP